MASTLFTDWKPLPLPALQEQCDCGKGKTCFSTFCLSYNRIIRYTCRSFKIFLTADNLKWTKQFSRYLISTPNLTLLILEPLMSNNNS